MIVSSRRAVLAGLSITSVAALAGCQSSKSMSKSNMNQDDLDFVTDAFNIIEFDRQECTLAQTQSKTPEVRALAADLLQQANDFDMRLRPIAAEAGIKPPTVLRTDLRVRAARIRLGQGADFDRSFIDDQIVSHQDALNMQEAMVDTSNSNPEIKALSRQGYDIVKSNLARLHALQRKLMLIR